jgi:hypothetical protein
MSLLHPLPRAVVVWQAAVCDLFGGDRIGELLSHEGHGADLQQGERGVLAGPAVEVHGELHLHRTAHALPAHFQQVAQDTPARGNR